MHSTVVRELWDEIKRFIPPGDRADAADTVVAVLINNDEDGESIQEAFKGDREIKKALTAYVFFTIDSLFSVQTQYIFVVHIFFSMYCYFHKPHRYSF